MSGEPTPHIGPSASGSTTPARSQVKLRSCAICAKRKVSCNKQYPCGRCQRAGIRCVPPSVEQTPRWARNMMRSSNGGGSSAPPRTPDKVGDRLQALEALVRDLRRELDQARSSSSHTVASSEAAGIFDHSSGKSAPNSASFSTFRDGEDDLNRTFWSRVDRELSDLREQTGPNDRQAEAMQADTARPQVDSHASDGSVDRGTSNEASLLFGVRSQHTSADTSALLPLPSQIPFLIDVYEQRLHSIMAVPHMPSLKRLARSNQKGLQGQHSSSEEALLFAVFYAAIGSLDTDEVMLSFKISKSGLSTQYRRGLETALAKANFLANPNENVVQALLILLAVARLEDSSRYLWMMTGIVIRMARLLRYHEDGAEVRKAQPFETEIQRRIWWNLCALDLRATEDLGTELTIAKGSFSTRLPLNVNDVDIWAGMQQGPQEHTALTDTSLLRLCSKVTQACQSMMAAGSGAAIADQVHLLDGLARELDQDYFSIADRSQHDSYLATAGTMRVFLARLSLLAFMPTLCSSAYSLELASKLLIAAIEIAECNHALNTHPSCQPWRWVYQTQQHWHAVVFMLLEICRRPWSPTMERGWIALQSPWLLRARVTSYHNPSVWVPLKMLIEKARSHREEELTRLRHDSAAAIDLAREDEEQMPIPASSVTFPMYYNEQVFQRCWWQAVNGPSIQTASGAAAETIGAWHASGADDYAHQSATVTATGTAARWANSQQSPNEAAHAMHAAPSTQMTATGGPEYVGNLDAFLSAEGNLPSFEGFDDLDLSNFDWSSWFESASGMV